MFLVINFLLCLPHRSSNDEKYLFEIQPSHSRIQVLIKERVLKVHLEIERKYLLTEIPSNLDQFESLEIEQSYISTNPTIRLRKTDTDYFLTFKTKGDISREEYEMKLTEGQFENLLSKTEGYTISKTRYLIPLENGLTAELDIFHGRLDGLVTVEVEFPTKEEEENFIAPEWFGENISLILEYKNSFLSQVEKYSQLQL